MLASFAFLSVLVAGITATPVEPRMPILLPRTNRWEELPPTPALPAPISTVKFARDGTELWFQKYNFVESNAAQIPIVMIHGGLGYSAYFGAVIDILALTHPVVAVDRRGHGRSTYNPDDVFTFDMFASDTHALLQSEGINSAFWVGWSDGAITALAGLLNSTIAPTIKKAFVFAASETPADTNVTFSDTATYAEFVSRSQTEYAMLQPSANFTDFGVKVETLEDTLPTWTDADLAVIDGSKVTVVGAEYDEAVNRPVAAHLNSVITGSSFVTLTNVSHFAPVQDPKGFAAAVETFASC